MTPQERAAAERLADDLRKAAKNLIDLAGDQRVTEADRRTRPYIPTFSVGHELWKAADRLKIVAQQIEGDARL